MDAEIKKESSGSDAKLVLFEENHFTACCEQLSILKERGV